MHVLCVDEEVPFPLNTGKRLRTYNLLKRLQEGHRVTFLCYGTGNEELPDCPHVKLVVLRSPLLEQKGGLFYLSLLRNVVSPLPYVVVRHYSHAMRSATEALLAHGDIDLIHCEWTPYTENVRHVLGRVPSVLSAHNVEAQIWNVTIVRSGTPSRKGISISSGKKCSTMSGRRVGFTGRLRSCPNRTGGSSRTTMAAGG